MLLLPWRLIDPNSWRNSSTWVIFGPVPLMPLSAAAENPPAIAQSRTIPAQGATGVAEFHQLQKLSEALVRINEKICELRPVEPQRGGWTEQEKKRLLQSIKRSRAK